MISFSLRISSLCLAVLTLASGSVAAQNPRPPTVAGTFLGAENLFQTLVPEGQVLVVKLTESLRIIKLPVGVSYALESAPGKATVLVSLVQASVVMTYPGGAGGLAKSESADQLWRFEVKLNEAVETSALSDFSEFDSLLNSANSDRFITFNTPSSRHWEGLILLGMLSGALVNSIGFKLLASGVFDKGPEFSTHALTAGVLATAAMTAPMALVLRRQAAKGPVKTWKRVATAVVVAGGLGICAGALGLMGSAFGR